MSLLKHEEDIVEFTVNAITVKQPIGDFLIASIPSNLLCDIAHFDVRRMLKERDIETYLGIQRPLSPSRVTELQTYVRTLDACFPTAVILAIESRCASFDADKNKLTLKNDPNPECELEPIYYRSIAKVLDGQHRIAGLIGYPNDNFEVNVSIFIDIDIEDQAYIFSTVNLAQTKVNRSLAYDLSELSKTRSPQKTCHNIAVALDQLKSSPMFQRIKRLGTATPGRNFETLNQATFVEALLKLISSDPSLDRDILKRGNRLPTPTQIEIEKHPLRPFFVNNEDMKIADILFRYFESARDRWPNAWESKEKGKILNKSNGFRALMRALKVILTDELVAYKKIPTKEEFDNLFAKVQLDDEDFTIDNFKPGTSGESELFHKLIDDMRISKQTNLFSN
ncbi:DGQHR domain-containing protein [Methylomonas sp. MS20]|uniref:DGQHR domain-containing protein n=1 Tax=unclassified Methylomonas TaxID=2608980 RepID=UPI0028A47D1B|nr:DGQHR domain-containing protein [Methylomonas sp. MV1]MDT4331197.1 DGQHR domain-containing protein [Methylomonas sp. MV1]